MRVRLRERYTDAQLAAVYPTLRRYGREGAGATMDDRQSDHLLRIQMTIVVAEWMYEGGRVADLACGDGQIARALCDDPILGDLVGDYPLRGPIEETLGQVDRVELFVCSETLEHLDDPDAVLRAVRGRAEKLVVSTPIGETGSGNLEHYWGWDLEDVRAMLVDAGWAPVVFAECAVSDRGYRYQIWGCR